MKGSNLYPYRARGILDMKEFTAGIMKYGVKMEHLSGKVISTSKGVTCVESV